MTATTAIISLALALASRSRTMARPSPSSRTSVILAVLYGVLVPVAALGVWLNARRSGDSARRDEADRMLVLVTLALSGMSASAL